MVMLYSIPWMHAFRLIQGNRIKRLCPVEERKDVSKFLLAATVSRGSALSGLDVFSRLPQRRAADRGRTGLGPGFGEKDRDISTAARQLRFPGS